MATKVLLIILAVICIVAPFIGYVDTITKAIQFNANCGDYLKMAADANNIDIAESRLSQGIEYLEKHDLTHGYTKIFVYSPKNDIGLWYENLKSAQKQLQDIKNTEITELEESNMLMKLRETLLTDNGSLTHPVGISIADNFAFIFWFNCLSWLLWFLAVIFIGICYEY